MKITKIYSAVIIALFIFANMSVASADAEEVKQTDKICEICKAAFIATDDYPEIINNHLYAVAVSRIVSYRQAAESMKKIFDSSPDGTPKRCAWLGSMVVIERAAALEAYIKYAECYGMGDADGCEFYSSQVGYHCNRAIILRNDFFNKYHM